ncbi:GTP binding domain [Fusarium oxysporum f. sp. vasinfectum]|nr:GTP binding domain [Fusarium oxysporum f. sp. vasinfectum]
MSSTLLPFLYPSIFLSRHTLASTAALRRRFNSTINDLPESRLNPAPDDYASPSFSDKAFLTLYAGRGGNGCISFLREAYLAEGPPNGGDGGHGGNVYIQAAHGETSLHKLARKRFVRAGRGKHGQGSAKSGTRGEDIIITVPVGTVVREIEREDPVLDEEMDMRLWRAQQKQKRKEERIGGLGNPHFTSRAHPRPMFATKGEEAVTMKIELELKLLADVGLVGLPNAGKSTLLRAITNSRTRVGNWAFTTLQPNIGTVVLDKYSGRPVIKSYRRYPAQLGLPEAVDTEPRTRFTIADIPGLIEGAHLDRGLGIAFLRHVERAGVLAFVIDLSAGNAVKALESLWREVGLYAQMRDEEEADRAIESRIDWDVTSDMDSPMNLPPRYRER